jgi:hypothetical protein
VAVGVLGLALLPFVIEVVSQGGSLSGFLTDWRLISIYVFVIAIGVGAIVDYMICKSRERREFANAPIGPALGLSLRILAFGVLLLFDIALWSVLLFMAGATTGVLVATGMFHLIWIGSALALRRWKQLSLVIGIQVTFIPLLIVSLLVLALAASG